MYFEILGLGLINVYRGVCCRNGYFQDTETSEVNRPVVNTRKKEGDALARLQRKLIRQMEEREIELVNYHLNIDDFQIYIRRANYDKHSAYRSRAEPQKWLDHYLAAKILDLTSDDVYIDIASSRHSPAADIYQRLYGCETFKQDLTFEEGMHGRLIGGNAESMPIPDGFATKMGMHSSLEHFEGDSDISFVTEAARVLRSGGMLCSVPLFLSDHYMIKTDPAVWPKTGMRFDSEAVVYKHDGWNCPFGRFYDVEHLCSRLLRNASDLSFKVYVVDDPGTVHESCRDRKFVAVFEKE